MTDQIGTMMNHPYSSEVVVGGEGKDLIRADCLAANMSGHLEGVY